MYKAFLENFGLFCPAQPAIQPLQKYRKLIFDEVARGHQLATKSKGHVLEILLYELPASCDTIAAVFQSEDLLVGKWLLARLLLAHQPGADALICALAA